MASSLMAGDRRWGQTRKSGMTVLGKVPKPINLPSQRLENHGLDPNVEIVPKGTLTWGSRPSLTPPNVWGSSFSPSANTDANSASPSHISGRPSSGGSVTRPSTSASERSLQTVSSAWGPNSRPSSASGILPENQMLAVVARPRSAETKPGSSQISSFAKPISLSTAWGHTYETEKLASSSNSNSFNLNSGDFPTLGSEKNPKSNIAQGHSSDGRPVSASGRVSVQKDTLESASTMLEFEPLPAENQTILPSHKGNINTWRSDSSPHRGSSITSNSGNWHRDPQQIQTYQHANMPTQQVDSWCRPPVQSATDGIWYRGGPPGGMCRPCGPPSSYPVESYAYCSHPPARPFLNSQAGPRHGAAGGYGPLTGAPYRIHTPDAYIVRNHPMGSMRTDAYPRQFYYENYCGSHPDHGNGNDQGGHVLGVAPCSDLSSQHPNENLKVDSGNFLVVPCYHAPAPSEEGGHAHEDNVPQYKVLLKQHDGSKNNDFEERKDKVVAENTEKSKMKDPILLSKKSNNDESTGRSSQGCKGSESPVLNMDGNAPVSTKLETGSDSTSSSRKGEDSDSQQHSNKKNSTLIEKIENLNNKARLVDGRSMIPTFTGEEKCKKDKNSDTKMDPQKVFNTSTLPDKVSAEKDDVENKHVQGEASLESNADVRLPSRASNTQSSAVGLLGPADTGLANQLSQRRVHGKQIRRFNDQGAEEWRKRSSGEDFTGINIREGMQDNKPSQNASEKKDAHHAKGGDEIYCTSSVDLADYKAQMKGMARQRAKQLQEEEEERTREQMARALAKLEELNRRTLAEKSSQPSHPITETQPEEDAMACPGSKAEITVIEVLSNSGEKSDKMNAEVPAMLQPNKSDTSLGVSVDMASQAFSSPVTNSSLSVSLTLDGIKRGGCTDTQFYENTASKQKQMPHKRQENRLEEKHEFQAIGVMVGSIIVGSENLCESVLPSNATTDVIHGVSKNADGTSGQHKKRNNRTTRHKNRDEASLNSIVQSAEEAHKDVESGHCKPDPADSAVANLAVMSESSNENRVQKSSDMDHSPLNCLSEQNGTPSQSAMQWRPQVPKRVIRNTQATKSVDKLHGTEAVMWAPVRSTSRKESSEEMQKGINKVNPDSSRKSVDDIELNSKSKRAELERYIPKPIAKELSQEEILQQPSLCHDHTASGSKDNFGFQGTTDVSAIITAAVPASSKNVENRPNRYGKAHTSWRRRGPPDSSLPLTSSLQGSSSDTCKENLKVDFRNETQDSCVQPKSKHDDLRKEKPKVSDDGRNLDGPKLTQSEPNDVSSMEKDHAKLNRGRRQPTKGHKVAGTCCSPRDKWEPGHGENDKAINHMGSTETDESSGRKSVRNGNQGASQPRSHWQPKSNPHPMPNPCPLTIETGLHEGQSQGNRLVKESALSIGGNHDQPAESRNVSVIISPEVRKETDHEVRGERRIREGTSLSQGSVLVNESSGITEAVSQNGDLQDKPISSGGRRHMQRNSWLIKGHEASSDGQHSGLGHDIGKHNPAANTDKHKQYQRSGYYNKQNDSFQHRSAGEESHNVSKPVGRYRERGGHNRRNGHNGTSNTCDKTE